MERSGGQQEFGPVDMRTELHPGIVQLAQIGE